MCPPPRLRKTHFTPSIQSNRSNEVERVCCSVLSQKARAWPETADKVSLALHEIQQDALAHKQPQHAFTQQRASLLIHHNTTSEQRTRGRQVHGTSPLSRTSGLTVCAVCGARCFEQSCPWASKRQHTDCSPHCGAERKLLAAWQQDMKAVLPRALHSWRVLLMARPTELMQFNEVVAPRAW